VLAVCLPRLFEYLLRFSLHEIWLVSILFETELNLTLSYDVDVRCLLPLRENFAASGFYACLELCVQGFELLVPEVLKSRQFPQILHHLNLLASSLLF